MGLNKAGFKFQRWKQEKNSGQEIISQPEFGIIKMIENYPPPVRKLSGILNPIKSITGQIRSFNLIHRGRLGIQFQGQGNGKREG